VEQPWLRLVWFFISLALKMNRHNLFVLSGLLAVIGIVLGVIGFFNSGQYLAAEADMIRPDYLLTLIWIGVGLLAASIVLFILAADSS